MRIFRVHFFLYNSIHNYSNKRGIMCHEDFPESTHISQIRDGFWTDRQGVPVARISTPGDTFITPGQILSIEVVQ